MRHFIFRHCGIAAKDMRFSRQPATGNYNTAQQQVFLTLCVRENLLLRRIIPANHIRMPARHVLITEKTMRLSYRINWIFSDALGIFLGIAAAGGILSLESQLLGQRIQKGIAPPVNPVCFRSFCTTRWKD
ncbi:MAG: hypothetical protein J5I98_00075 [Phaeodactylibacter sp.]|nr:hypothetical protein [Phaeodactylibacter sp.]